MRGITAHRINTSDELILTEVAIDPIEILFRGREDIDGYGRVSAERVQEILRSQVKRLELSDCARF